MATAKMLPSGNWRVNLFVGTENGKRKYKSFTAHTKKEAEYLAAIYNMGHHGGDVKSITVEEAIENYISNKTNILSPSTVCGYRVAQNSAFTAINRKKVTSLKQSDVQGFVNELSKTRSPKTVRNIYHLFYAAIKECDRDINFTIKLPKKRKPNITIPSEAEIKTLLKLLEKNPSTRIAVLIAATLGLRRGEICALEFSDLRNHHLSVNKSVARSPNGNYVVKSTKTESGIRTLPVPEWLEKEILSIKKTDREDEKIIQLSPGTLSNSFMEARNSIGLSFRFHDLRHYNASIMLALGIPDKYAMQRIGHASPAMLRNVYQHIIESAKNEQDEKMNDYMENLLK